jgi:hypothetical protein
MGWIEEVSRNIIDLEKCEPQMARVVDCSDISNGLPYYDWLCILWR